MAKKLISVLDERLKGLGFETFVQDDVIRGQWMKFPTRQYTWRIRRLGTTRFDAEGPVFTCCRTSLPQSTKGDKYKELKAWAHACIAYAKRQSTPSGRPARLVIDNTKESGNG